jgi:hypothetical protein
MPALVVYWSVSFDASAFLWFKTPKHILSLNFLFIDLKIVNYGKLSKMHARHYFAKETFRRPQF